MRNAMFAGMTRFTDFQRSLGIARNILTKRLGEFVDAALFELRHSDSGHAEHMLTGKGLELKPVIVALTEWGDRGDVPSPAGVKARVARRFLDARYGRGGPSHDPAMGTP
jgi:DNA-binding HxlR family transcriptional regulator